VLLSSRKLEVVARFGIRADIDDLTLLPVTLVGLTAEATTTKTPIVTAYNVLISIKG
jgi:hypothetical protein